VIEVKRTLFFATLAIGLTIGLTGISGSALADVNPDSPFVETGEADECTETVETPDGETQVTYPCDLAGVEICTKVVHDPLGMPQLMPYPCGVYVNTPSESQTTSNDLICFKAVKGPQGMPQLMPYPCALQK
jgi:hypothetical protein